MNPEFAVELLKGMIFMAISIAAPFLVTAMVVGLGVGLIQSVTTINEQTLTFVPKVVGIVALMVLLMPWVLRRLIEFATAVIEKMPQMVQ